MFWRLTRRVVYFKCGERELSAEYSSIERVAKRKGPHRIVVVPVNSTFDMVIEPPGLNALVAEGTNHGRFIKIFQELENVTQLELNDKVQQELRKRNLIPVTTNQDKTHGNQADYPIGTYVTLASGNTTFLLFALSRFDERNNAHPGEESPQSLPLDALMKAINDCNQNCEVYIPLMGTGNSGYKLSDRDSFNCMKYFFLSRKDDIEGKYRILVYSGIKDEVSILRDKRI